jgi:hypothetical protein
MGFFIYFNRKREVGVGCGLCPSLRSSVSMRAAKAITSKMILDTSVQSLCFDVQEGVFMIKPNLRELGDTGEAEIAEESEQEALARRIVEKGPDERGERPGRLRRYNVLLAAAVYVPALSLVLHTAQPGSGGWVLIFAMSLASLAIGQLIKASAPTPRHGRTAEELTG